MSNSYETQQQKWNEICEEKTKKKETKQKRVRRGKSFVERLKRKMDVANKMESE